MAPQHNTGVMSFAARLLPKHDSAARLPAAVVVVYLLAYVGLDRISYIHPLGGLNITPWNPQAALAVALLMWRPAAWWLAWLGLLTAEVVVRGPPSPWPAEALSCATLTVAYVLLAQALLRGLGRPTRLSTRRDFLVLLAIVTLGALVDSVCFIGGLAAVGVPPPAPLQQALLRYWVGDLVGLLVTLPLLLSLGHWRLRTALLSMLRTVECWIAFAVLLALAAFVFTQSEPDQFKFFYVFFLPVVWLAARFGIAGATWAAAVVQALLIVGVHGADHSTATVFELQLLMATLALTGFLLGATVDERDDVARALRSSLHHAAAGQTAAALAHELNQPLAAMGSYAEASRLLAERLAAKGREEEAEEQALVEVARKLVNEATRASEVVKRLRDLLREGKIELVPCDMGAVVEQARSSQAERAASMNVELHCEPASSLPPVWVDAVQMAIVLRNLVSNAIDAAAQQPAKGRVEVRMSATADELVLSVEDNGPGFTASEAASVFEPRVSRKPGGMGIGLSISRAIVEAHGGRLWAEPGPAGRMVLTIPLQGEAADA
jgi:signal transduction histidine kinase